MTLETKTVPEVQDLPIVDGAWDGDAARERLRDWATDGDTVDWSKYALGFAYFDQSNPEVFGSYKLPHHDVKDGELVTSKQGVFAAMGALLGARGGVDMPTDEKVEAYNHLADHYEQMGDEAPEMDGYGDYDDDKKEVKAYSTTVEMKADEPRTVIAKISTTSVDRDGDVVLPRGLKGQEDRKNPVVLLNHNNGSLPIGKALKVERTSDAVIAKVQFAERPKEHPVTAEWIPDTVYSLFKQGILRAFSVGFVPLDMRDATDKDRKKYGDYARRVITQWNLLEFSVVPVPANQDALVTQVAKSSSFLREAWCLPTTKQKLVVARPAVFKIGDSTTTRDVRPLIVGRQEASTFGCHTNSGGSES